MSKPPIARKQSILFYLLLILVFVSPLLYTSITTESFEFPKMILIYIFSSLIFVVAFWDRPINLPIKPILLYLSSIIISTVLSMHMYTSMWGYFSRFNGGLISTICFVLIYLATTQLKQTHITQLYNAVVFSALPVAVLALLQHFQGMERATSTLGQPNWTGTYLVIALGIASYYTVTKELKELYALSVVLFIVGIWVTYSLSSLIAAGAVLGTVLYINRSHINWQIISAILLGCTFAIVRPGILASKIYDAQIIEAPQNMETETPIDNEEVEAKAPKLTDSGNLRYLLWRDSLQIPTQNLKTFLVGTGPETFPYIFQTYRSEAFNYTSEWNYIMNKPHNFYLETLIEEGILGVVTYVSMLGVLGFKAIKKRAIECLIIIITVTLTNLFSWPVASVSLLFWIGLGELNASA
ncbi:MAG: O-antigen ligase family protein [Patescibacteria group bacterium]|uniref:O-antigen ligase family protein n=1 Tax=candidate division WWE3 bacterium TaxID=2053526 RepID=A0A955J2H8_UNCKA|nr:O-antigen ligase family protein [candidate division WWE3 bacterium]